MSAAPDFDVPPTPDEMPAGEARRAFADVVGRAQYAGHITYITHRGKRVAAIVPADAAAWLEEYEDNQLAKMAAEALAEGGEPVPLEQVLSKLGL
jgi:prevent-host-death family protein